MQIQTSEIIALFALLLSCFATWQTFKFNKRQNSLIEIQEKLNALLLEKETGEAESDKKADLGASIVNIGSNKKKLKIWNKGKAPAKNIRLSFPEGNSILSQREIESIFPLESLEQFQSVELAARITIGMRISKFAIQIIWDDGIQQDNEKTVHVTL